MHKPTFLNPNKNIINLIPSTLWYDTSFFSEILFQMWLDLLCDFESSGLSGLAKTKQEKQPCTDKFPWLGHDLSKVSTYLLYNLDQCRILLSLCDFKSAYYQIPQAKKDINYLILMIANLQVYSLTRVASHTSRW